MSETTNGTETLTIWIENEKKTFQAIEDRLGYGDSMGEWVREACKLYLEINKVLDEYDDVNWEPEQLRHHVRRYLRQGLKSEIEAE